MTFSSGYLPNSLSRLVRNKLQNVGYLKPENFERKEAYTIKELLLIKTKGGGIREIDKNHFIARIKQSDYYDSLTIEFTDGLDRIQHLDRCLKNLKASGSAGAWQVVTAYYIAFFSCIELLKCAGDFVSYLASGEIQQLAINADEGTFQVRAQLIAADNEIELTYHKSNSRHHAVTWQKLMSMINSIPRASGIEGVVLANIKRGLENHSPSQIRNEWNYQNAELFGPVGERRATYFKKLIGQNGAGKLVATSRQSFMCNDNVWFVAAMREILLDAISELKPVLEIKAHN